MTRTPLFPTAFRSGLEGLAAAIGQIRKSIVMGKEVKLFLFTGDACPYVEKPKECTKNLPELTNKLGKVAGHMVKAQKTIGAAIHQQRTTREGRKSKFPLQERVKS